MPLSPELSGLTFGVEIECYLPAGLTREALAAQLCDAGVPATAEMYNHQVRSGWKLVTDGSLRDYSRGCELVSPILSGDAGLASVEAVCAQLVTVGATVDRSTGLHVHVGVPGQELPFFKEVLRLYAKYEKVIDGFMAPSRRGSANVYAQSTTFTPAMAAATDLRALQRAYNGGRSFRHDARYRKVNLEAYWRHGTVEFRQHQGTIEARKITNWVKFLLKLVNRATRPEPEVRAARVGDNQVIELTGMRNPYRYYTNRWERANLFQDGMTVAQFLAAGGRRFDIPRSVEQGYITVSGGAAMGNDLASLMTVIGADEVERAYFEWRTVRFAARMAEAA